MLWRGDFDVTRRTAQPVLNERERAHMRDVRGVFTGFWLAGRSPAAVVLVVSRSAGAQPGGAGRRVARGRRRRARRSRSAIAVVGAFVVLAFDAAFEVFHRLFFSAGSYTFDPRDGRLVQLFPEQFWSETPIAVGVVALVAAILTVVARRPARRRRRVVARAPSLTAHRAGT